MEKPRFIPPDLETVQKRLGEVSPSFCLAKWHNVTLHLHKGLTHSCHYSHAHPIPLEEISANPAALHNTRQKIESRRQMLAGGKPADCDFCWKMEALSGSASGERLFKSQSDWAWPYFDEILVDPLGDKAPPKYLEVSFGRSCNFKCSYCSPYFSSGWVADVLKHGPYPARNDVSTPHVLETFFEEEENPYIRAFWRWWPELKKSLHTFRITGGEPLLSPNTFHLLEQLVNEPAPGLTLAINSNLGTTQASIERMIFLVQSLLKDKKIKEFRFYTSIDTWGKQAEYIRNGLNQENFWRNSELILAQLPECPITFMATFNALSVPGYRGLLEKVLQLREKYYTQGRKRSPLFLDTVALTEPEFMAANILPPESQSTVNEHLHFMRSNFCALTKKRWDFYDWEVDKLSQILTRMKEELPVEILRKRRADFYRFFSAHDIRRGTNFLEAFPQMASFWKECESASEKSPQTI